MLERRSSTDIRDLAVPSARPAEHDPLARWHALRAEPAFDISLGEWRTSMAGSPDDSRHTAEQLLDLLLMAEEDEEDGGKDSRTRLLALYVETRLAHAITPLRLHEAQAIPALLDIEWT